MESYRIRVGDMTFEVEVEEAGPGEMRVKVDGRVFTATKEYPARVRPAPAPSAAAPQAAIGALPQAARPVATAPGEKALRAPMPGVIRQVLVSEGDRVADGQKVAVMEAMKMENDLLAPWAGRVDKVAVKAGTTVATGDLIMSFD